MVTEGSATVTGLIRSKGFRGAIYPRTNGHLVMHESLGHIGNPPAMASSFSFDNEAPIFLQSSFSSSMLLHDFAISRSSGLISSSFNLAPSVARFESFLICGAKGRITYDAAAAFRGSRIFLADLLESHATMFRSCSYTKCHLRQHRAARQ